MSLIGFLLTQCATVTPWIRYANGDDIYGKPETRRCRVQWQRDLEVTYKDPDGTIDQVLGRAKMYCTGPHIPERSRVEVDGETFTVLTCYPARGFAEDHLEVVLQ